MKQNMDGLLVDHQAEPWRNAHTWRPNIGATVRALSRDGIDIGKITWTRDSILSVDGWLPMNPIPEDIKAMQVARYYTPPDPDSGNQLPEEVFDKPD